MWRILSVYVLLIMCSFVHSDPKVPCLFIFGDSLSDPGNNNALNTYAKANYPPYGVDFAGGLATGRFTNGLTSSDVLTGLLGIQGLISPFSNESKTNILKGVNYASGAAGIRPESGSHLGDRIWLAKQVENHKKTITELESFVKGPVSDYLNKCLYTVNIGSDDYINNYFMPQFYSTKSIFSPDQFATTLVTEYELQLKVLYNNGARRTAISGLGLIGCTPAEIRMNNATLCVPAINEAVQLFNKKLLGLAHSLNLNLVGAKFTFIDIAAMQTVSPLSLGFTTHSTCCKVRSDYQCEASIPPCPNRNVYAFMDGYHPNEFLNVVTATFSFNSPSQSFVNPVDINNLVSS